MSRQMKVKSLSLNRKTQQTPPKAEDSANPGISDRERAQVSRLELALNSPISRQSRHSSTPIHSNGEPAEDSADQDYVGGSPISMFPCTQESVGEVAWDWNGAGNTGSRNGLLNVTPKRRQLAKKKRLAKGNSPLLNYPQKRKIVEPDDDAERINKFAEEFKALADKIKSEKEFEAEKKEDDLLDISEMQTQLVREPEPDIHEAETPRVNEEKIDVSLEDFFDDSIDACMVECSQEIEDKLRLESAEGSVNGDEEKGAKMRGENKDCGSGIEGKNEKSGTDGEIPASQIPDDSLDDCLALCLDDDHDFVDKYLEPKKSKEEKAGAGEGKKWSFDRDDGVSAMKQPAETSPCFKRKQHCMSSEVGPTTQSRKFFKAKSLSDSLCLNSSLEKVRRSLLNPNANSKPGCSGKPPQISKCTSNVNLSSKSRTNDVFPAYKLANSISSAGSRNDFSRGSMPAGNNPANENVSYSYRRNDSPLKKTNIPTTTTTTTTRIGNSDPYAVPINRGEKSSIKDIGGSSQLRCTPEEIERKRAEARMKLEANMLKKQMNFTKSKVGINMSGAKRPAVRR